MANNDLQSEEEKMRMRDIESLSTMDKIKYKNLESKYEVDKEIGAPVGEDKHRYIMSRIPGNKHSR